MPYRQALTMRPSLKARTFSFLNYYLQGDYMMIAWWLHDDYMVLHGGYMMVASWLYGDCMVAAVETQPSEQVAAVGDVSESLVRSSTSSSVSQSQCAPALKVGGTPTAPNPQ